MVQELCHGCLLCDRDSAVVAVEHAVEEGPVDAVQEEVDGHLEGKKWNKEGLLCKSPESAQQEDGTGKKAKREAFILRRLRHVIIVTMHRLS